MTAHNITLRLPVCMAVLFCVICAQTIHANAPTAEIYVSPAGADSNPGTKEMPFQTLVRARDEARSLKSKVNGDIVVFLRAGTYCVTEPLVFGVGDSGVDGHSVEYRAFDHETPVISGGVTVTNWVLDHGKIFKANLNWDRKLRGLYVNGKRATMTQADFKGQGAWGEFIVNGTEPWAETPGKTLDGIQFDSSQMPRFSQPEDVELLQHRVWNFLVMGVRDIDTQSNRTLVKLQQPYGAIAATMAWGCSIKTNGVFTIRNAFELLNQPGQFYFNRHTHTLYYWPRPGEDMTTAEVIAPLSEGLIRVTGTSTNDRVKNLYFSGLTFAYDHWLLNQVADSRGMVGVQSLGLYTKFRDDGDWHKSHYNICDLPQGTIELRNCENIRIERNRFLHLGSGVAVSLVNDAVDCIVAGNVFNDLSGNAINVGHPQHYLIGDGPLFSAGVEGVCARDVIKDNWIRNVSLDFKQEEAISGFFTDSVEISHNDIQGTPYGGIALGWWWGNAGIPPSPVPRNNIIASNRVVDTQQVLRGDGGSIYVLGEQPGGRIEGNYISASTRLLYPDDGSAYWTIARNVLDLRDVSASDKPGAKCWLHLWVSRIHDLKIFDNYTTHTNILNKGINCEPVDTHVENPLSAQARAIIDAAGLEPSFKDIVPVESGK